MSTSYKFGRDINHAQKMAEGLENYVRGQMLYGHTAGVFSTLPSMTIGALLLRLRRLDVLRPHLKDHQSKKLDKAIDRYLQTRSDWTVHYEEKMAKEALSRTEAMKAFFYECSDNIRECIGLYKPEMSRRTIVQELLREMDNLNIRPSAELVEKLEETDEKLRKVTEEAEFQWADILKPAYDPIEFWWLYHSPPNID